ncbi:CS1-pili formation C-terminal domain-containing protein [Aeromonas sp. 602658]
MKTVTVIGRLLDEKGAPLKGAMVVNHAGRTMSEVDGFFAVEMSARNPILKMEINGISQCETVVDVPTLPINSRILFLGDLACHSLETKLSSVKYD